MRATKLQTEYMNNPMAIDIKTPRITWNIEGGKYQSAFRIVAKDDKGKQFDSGKIRSKDMAYIMPEFSSRARVSYQLKVWDENYEMGEIAEAFYEMGLEKKDWRAKWINPEGQINIDEQQPASYLKKNFNVKAIGKARLYITAHGCYEVKINGEKVEGFVFAPGISQYDKRLQYQTYDVEGLLRVGKNEVKVTVGDGYYRGQVGYLGDRNIYGSDLALLCQLEINETVVMISDETWVSSQNGPIRENDMKRGEFYDATIEQISNWHSVEIKEFGYDLLVCSNCYPVTEHERFPGSGLINTPIGETVYDFKQNIAGYVEFEVTAHKGQMIRLIHGETLDRYGNFTINNFQNFLKNVDQEVTYICKEGRNVFKPSMSVFGFRYVKVMTDVDLSDAKFTAIAVYSDMEFTGEFICGNKDINQLFKNSVWSQKGNFLEIPTDCPTRERGGFSGDLQIYSNTALYLGNTYPIIRKYVEEQKSTQFEDGCISQHVPTRGPREEWDGSAGWSDSICILPYRMYLRTGDERFLTDNYEAMKKWCGFCLNRAKDSMDFRKKDPKPYLDYLVDTGAHWGEWLEPGWSYNPSDAMREIMKTGMPDLATSYMAFSLRITAIAAELLGKIEEQKYYSNAAENAKLAYREYCTEKGLIHSQRQCQYVRPIALDMISEEEKQQVCDELAEKIRERGNSLNTGFLSTHELLRILCDYGHADVAYDLLLKTDGFSWLKQIQMGATTVWEGWEAIDDEGNPKLSLNHYSLGTVAGWLMDRVAGIIEEKGKITIKPYPNKILHFAEGKYISPFGTITSKWIYDGDRITYRISVPCNTEAEIILSGKEPITVGPGTYEFT